MIIGVMMVRDEDDVLDALIAHMLAQGVGRLVIADNGSTDGTAGILDRWARTAPVEVRQDDEVGFHQSEKMTRLAQTCGATVGDWVIPFDADEWFYSPAGLLGDLLLNVPADVLKCWGWDHRPHPSDDPDDPNPFRRMRWREPDTQRLPKVMFRYHPDARLHMGNHDVDRPGRREDATGFLEYRHMGIRSFDQFTRKARNGQEAAEAATLSPTYCSHWREWGAMTEAELKATFDDFCRRSTIEDPAPLP